MRYRLKYQTRGRVESYIATATSFISTFNGMYDTYELVGILQNIADEIEDLAKNTEKGLTAKPEFEIVSSGTTSLQVYNTQGREVLMVYFERVYDKGEGPQIKRL